MGIFTRKTQEQKERELDKKIKAEELKLDRETALLTKKSALEEKRKKLMQLQSDRRKNTPLGKLYGNVTEGLKKMGENQPSNTKKTEGFLENAFGKEQGTSPFSSAFLQEGKYQGGGGKRQKMKKEPKNMQSGLVFHY